MNKTANNPIILEMKGIGKSFPGVIALDGVNLSIREGEVHALLGENGAGKSTLIKILAGAYPKDQGEIIFQGQSVDIKSPYHAQQLGISTIYQEFNLARHLTVPENIFLGHLPQKGLLVDWDTAKARSQEILTRLGVSLQLDVPCDTLSVAEQQLVEIAKALTRETRVLIMDEPSAVLGDKDMEKLFQIVRSLTARGISIIYISHRLSEVFEIADRVTVFKDGRLVGSKDVSDVTMDSLVKMMVGRDLQDIYPKKHAKIGKVLLDIKGLNRPKVLHNISLQVRAGEIVGLAGMRGAGRTELLRAIFGADSYEGTMTLDGKPFNPTSPKDAIDQKVALVTEDRKAEGLLLQQSVKFNTTISGLKEFCTRWIINRQKEVDHVQQMVKKLRIKTPGINNLVVGMSGGNQQKVIIARFLGARVLLLDEPTRGIDVGSKNEIYQVMVDLAEQGLAVLMVSSELPEVLGMSDRVLVMHEGHIAKELSRAEVSEESIMKYATGSHLES